MAELSYLQSARALELHLIVEDTARPRDERLQAAKELAEIETIAERRNEARILRALRVEAPQMSPTTLPTRPIADGGFRKTWPPGPCRKHGGLVPCSECHKKRKRRRPPTLRYAELAREAGWEPLELRQPFAPGRKTPEQLVADVDRREALRTVATTLRREHYTQKAIAEALGCRQATVAKLLKASPG